MKLFVLGLTSLMLVNTGVYAAPTNEQLYQMLLDMKTEQANLKKEVAESKIRESDLKAHLDKTKAELATAKKQLDESPKDTKQKTSNVKEGFFASAGALYVKPIIDGNRSPSGYSNSSINGGELDYEPGFQVSAGYQANNNWDYTLGFKHFDTDSDVTNSGNSYGYFLGKISPVVRYKSDYDALDFEIGKLFSLSDNVALRVSGGIRYAAMDENLSSSNSGNIPLGFNDLSIDVTESNSSKNDFWGIGPRITAAPTWKPFGNNFRVFGNVGASFLNGEQSETYAFESSCSSRSPFVGCSGSKFGYNKRQDSFVTMIEAGSGIGYTIKANLVDIDFQTGYQFEHWIVDDQTANILFRGFHGAYGTVGVKF